MDFTLIPGKRISTKFKPVVKIYSKQQSTFQLNIYQGNQLVREQTCSLEASEDYTYLEIDTTDLQGEFRFDLSLQAEDSHLQKQIAYEIIDSGVASTRLLDGCWISLVHWSDDEARMFNTELKQLTDEDWANEIEDMHQLGINNIMIQNVFDNDEYVFEHHQGLENYQGKAFYPSKLYPTRFAGLKAQDPLKAIFTKADELNMNVFLGVGLYAWFDYSEDSLQWHKKVAKELFEMYGHHPSFYSFYLSEELHGSFYDDYAPDHADSWREVPAFFQAFAEFIKELAPTKPISMAPNNIKFHEHPEKWLPTLENIDILLPFAFARDLENLNIHQIKDLCDQANTHFWVDMEIFQFPFEDTGLIPKNFDELLAEIKIYDDVENIFGYQYTGLISNPKRSINLGGKAPQEVFVDYQHYYRDVIKTQEM